MIPEQEPAPVPADGLAARKADVRLLEQGGEGLPAALGRPETEAPWALRGAIVGTGAALTGLSLLAGVILLAIGIVHALTSGVGLGPLAVPVAGLVLLSTHWGWVHVAEATAGAIEGRRTRALRQRNAQWLERIEPYERWEVTTVAGEQGGITITTTRYAPIPAAEGTFSFTGEVVSREEHGPEEPAAVLSERAETLRHSAAEQTHQARVAWEAALEAWQLASLERDEEDEQRSAARSTAEALSERLNTHLRQPPLEE